MGEIVPGVSVLAIIFPDRAPLALAQVGTPTFPVLSVTPHSSVFGCLRHNHPLSFSNPPVFFNSLQPMQNRDKEQDKHQQVCAVAPANICVQSMSLLAPVGLLT